MIEKKQAAACFSIAPPYGALRHVTKGWRP
jgi:hypothetical protein